MKKINIIEFKDYLALFRHMIEQGIEEDSNYAGEADGLLESIERVEAELAGIQSEEDMDEEAYERIYPDLMLLSECFNQITKGMKNEIGTGDNIEYLDFSNEDGNEDDEDEDDEDEDEDENQEEFENNYHFWVQEFIKSNSFKQLSKRAQSHANLVLGYFVEFVIIASLFHSKEASDPSQWAKEEIREVCLKIMPEEVAADETFFADIPSVLASFFNFLADKKFLSHGKKLAEYIQSIEADIIKASKNVNNWEFAKLIKMGK
jgi:hypothetical protein